MVMNDEQGSYHSLLMDYAAGTLDEAYALAIAAHIALSPRARKIVAAFEGIGGGLLHDCCEPVAMKDDALACVLAKIESCCDSLSEDCAKAEQKCAEVALFPSCLQSYIEPDNDHLPWEETSAGLRTITIKTTCRKTRATIVKMAPATSIPHRRHTGYDLTLVLDGSYSDGSKTYGRGDLVILESAATQTSIAHGHDGCVWLAVTPTPSGFFPLIGRLACLLRR